MVMGPFLNNHYWPATAFPKVDVPLTFRLDVYDSWPAKLRRRIIQIWQTAEAPGGCLTTRVLQTTCV